MKLSLSLVVAALLLAPAAAYAGQRTDQELAHLAQATTHGPLQDSESINLLERRYLNHERLTVTCGTISRLAVQRLHHLGVRARVVGTISYDKANGYDDGHIMLEVRNGQHWNVYDLDNNRQPVDQAGNGITLERFVSMPHRHYRVLAHDKPYDLRGVKPSVRAYSAKIHTTAGLERWYDHILGAPLIFATTDPGSRVYMSQPADVVAKHGWTNYYDLTAIQWHALYA